MLVVRLPDVNWDFRPPGTISLLGMSWGYQETVKRDGLKVVVSDMWRKVELEVKANSTVDEWQKFNTPAADGQSVDSLFLDIS